jgi:hypothetical protein
MKCSLLTLSCALDGELSRERQSELEAHLVTCERCRTGLRYLREETERISQLVKVELPAGTATALLDRAKILTATSPAPSGENVQPPHKSRPVVIHEQVADPFNLMGLGTPVIESGEAEMVEEEPAAANDELVATGPDELAGPDAYAAESFEDPPDDGPEILDTIESEAPPTDAVLPMAETGDDEVGATGEPPGPTDDARMADFEDEADALGPQPWPMAGPDTAEPAADLESEAGIVEGPLVLSEPAAYTNPIPGSDLGFSNPFETLPGVDGEAAFLDAGTTPFDSPPFPVDHSAETPIELPPLPLNGPTAVTPPPPSILEPASSGWQPNQDLNLGPGDIAAAEPQFDALGRDAITSRFGAADPGLSDLPSSRSPFSPLRPVDAVAPDRLAGGAGGPPDRVNPGRRRPAAAPGGRGGRSQQIRTAAPRSWTRTATIAIAAVAVVLIGWSLLHHSSTPTPTHSHKTAPVKATASPTTAPTPTPTATAPSLTLTGSQTFGGIGSGYQVQSARYGLHNNGSQLWVVFQLVTGSGAPKITTGFDGAQTLYVEMAGVAPGTVVAQPAAGTVVTSVTVGHVTGFSGAVYVLKLSRAAQVSGSLLPGSPTSSAGERVVLVLS